MTAPTDLIFTATAWAFGKADQIFEVEAPNISAARDAVEDIAADYFKVAAYHVHIRHIAERTSWFACAGCGEPEGSSYAKPCCTPDNMIEA